jgi:hypothetical protein
MRDAHHQILMKTLFNDGVMEAVEYEDGWVFFHWLQNTRGKLQKKLVRDVQFVERMILQKGLKGWFTTSDHAHQMFHRFIQRVGANFASKDSEKVWFRKPINKQEDIFDVRIAA